MTVTIISMLMSGCEDRFDSRRGNPVGEGEPVEVTLRIGLADGEDGYSLSASPSTKADMSGEGAAFGLDLVPSARTKTGTVNMQPDSLYNLEIRQYDSDGVYKGGSGTVADRTELGAPVTATFQTLEHCQLVLVAWGKGNTKRLGTGTLSAAQDVTLDASIIKDLKPEVQADMKKMPYVLHLKDVNVTSDGRIYSAEGEAINVRLLLKRLATRLTVNWIYSVTGYSLQQILIHSIPTDYKVVAAPDKTDRTYPSLLDQFRTIQVPADQIASGSYSCWIPANVRGSNPNATSQAYRIKSNAPTGSSYIRFISVMNGEGNENKKLDYRLYLGGKETTDFNLYGNTDYSYTAKFTHTQLPVNDLRVTIVDPVSASVDNHNFVNTANCFMVAPGGAFNFNPYKYTINGEVGENSTLQGWCNNDNVKIQSVKVLWQTLENGDVGDPVLGTVNSSTDHTNIVDLTIGNSFADTRIYCRVAPNTTGGSGLIAAYDGLNGTGNILWSWHIWVTDYNPEVTGSETVLTPVNKRKLKFTYNTSGQPPMMDRNLGAIAGFTLADPPKNPLDMSKANGFHYQWGRKDPFPSSYSATPVSVIKGLTSKTNPPKGMLNRYGPDGITYVPLVSVGSKSTVRNACQHPTNFYLQSNTAVYWCSENTAMPTLWNNPNNDNGVKTVFDPCPAGWRVISYKHLTSFFTTGFNNNGEINTGNENIAASVSSKEAGGGYFYYAAQGSGEATYVRATGYWRYTDEFHFIGEKAIFWTRDFTSTSSSNYAFCLNFNDATQGNPYGAYIHKAWYPQDAHTTRCIQERAD
ncbi:DUF4906 domain-containing protein [uncultured Parabacteroides sp.]|uniref:DUF4906 domain-containing protein n=1 Tax=uncultured Parabacteroides sp. TaxID=512312 RepID=UPI0025E4DB59|nr:DUF4906 domain-containing protein [uncultured Parabacteroides sp.]